MQAIIYDYGYEKSVMIVARVTPTNTRNSSWTLAWFWSKLSTDFAPWEYFVKNTTKTQSSSDKHGKSRH